MSRTDRHSLAQGFLKGCLLLLLGERPAHGYDLVDGLKGLGLPRIDRGHLYRTLHALERDGLVRSSVSASEVGPPRRTYELMERGEQRLHGWAITLRETQWTMSKCLRRYDSIFADVRGSAAARPPVAVTPLRRRPSPPQKAYTGADAGPVTPMALIGTGWSALGLEPVEDGATG